MLDRQIHLAVAQLRVMLDPVLGALHRQSPDAGTLTQFRHLILAQRPRPALDPLVEFLLVARAGTSTFFIMMVISLVDVMAGFIITARTAQRDIQIDRIEPTI